MRLLRYTVSAAGMTQILPLIVLFGMTSATVMIVLGLEYDSAVTVYSPSFAVLPVTRNVVPIVSIAVASPVTTNTLVPV